MNKDQQNKSGRHVLEKERGSSKGDKSEKSEKNEKERKREAKGEKGRLLFKNVNRVEMR